MEGSCSTGQSPQRTVVPVEEEEEEEEEEELRIVHEINHQTTRFHNPHDHNTLQNLQASYTLN
jgi:hypothetical protein